MDGKWLARGGAIAFVAVAITMTALEMRDGPHAGDPLAIESAAVAEADPLRAELVRCQSIGEAGASDGRCLRAWAENRRRFLAPGARPLAVIPSPVSASAENSYAAALSDQGISNEQVR